MVVEVVVEVGELPVALVASGSPSPGCGESLECEWRERQERERERVGETTQLLEDNLSALILPPM